MPRLQKHKGDSTRPRKRIHQPPEGVMDHPVLRYVWQGCRSRISFTAHTVVRWGAFFDQEIELADAIRFCEAARNQLWCHIVQPAPLDTGDTVYLGDA